MGIKVTMQRESTEKLRDHLVILTCDVCLMEYLLGSGTRNDGEDCMLTTRASVAGQISYLYILLIDI